MKTVNCQVLRLIIAGLQVTSRLPCWWSRTKAFLSAGKWTLFWCKFSRKISFVLTTNMAALSRGCKPRIITGNSPLRMKQHYASCVSPTFHWIWSEVWDRDFHLVYFCVLYMYWNYRTFSTIWRHHSGIPGIFSKIMLDGTSNCFYFLLFLFLCFLSLFLFYCSAHLHLNFGKQKSFIFCGAKPFDELSVNIANAENLQTFSHLARDFFLTS